MKTAIFEPKLCLESDTLYQTTAKVIDIWPEHCTITCGAKWSPPELAPANMQKVLTAFILKGLKNVTIDLGGAKLLFHGRILPFLLEDCKNVQFKNLSIDYDRYFYTQMDIVQAFEDRVRLQIPEEYPFEVRDGALVAKAPTWESDTSKINALIMPFDLAAKHPVRDMNFWFYYCGNHPFIEPNPPMQETHVTFEPLAGREVMMHAEKIPAPFHPGVTLLMSHEDRRKPAFDATRVSALLLDHVRILQSGGGGLIAYECHDILLKHFDAWLDGETHGLLCSNADMGHCFHCDGTITMEDCRVENIEDDVINVHGQYAVMTATEGAHGVHCVIKAYGLHPEIPLFRAGDTLRAFRGSTQEPLGEFTISNILDGNKNHLFFELQENVGGLSGAISFENLRMPELYIRRLVTGNKYRAILPSTGKKCVIEDSTFFQCPTAINLTGDRNFWYESGPMNDLTVRNCRFTEPGLDTYPIIASPIYEPTARAPYFHHHVVLENNRFDYPGGKVLDARGTDDIQIRHNIYTHAPGFHFENCGKIDLQ